MLKAVATFGYVGNLPKIGGLFTAALGLGLALALFMVTRSGAWLIGGWALVFGITAWALPRALSSGDVPSNSIVIDRVLGIWLVAGPIIPAVLAGAQVNPVVVPVAILGPLLAYHLLLVGPLRRMGQSDKPWARLGDDLIAGGVVMLISFGLTFALLINIDRTALS